MAWFCRIKVFRCSAFSRKNFTKFFTGLSRLKPFILTNLRFLKLIFNSSNDLPSCSSQQNPRQGHLLRKVTTSNGPQKLPLIDNSSSLRFQKQNGSTSFTFPSTSLGDIPSPMHD